jgi:hypothetical protein
MLGIDASVSALVVGDTLMKSVFAFFLGWPIYLGLRRVLRPALVEDSAVQRRNRPTTLEA